MTHTHHMGELLAWRSRGFTFCKVYIEFVTCRWSIGDVVCGWLMTHITWENYSPGEAEDSHSLRYILSSWHVDDPLGTWYVDGLWHTHITWENYSPREAEDSHSVRYILSSWHVDDPLGTWYVDGSWHTSHERITRLEKKRIHIQHLCYGLPHCFACYIHESHTHIYI